MPLSTLFAVLLAHQKSCRCTELVFHSGAPRGFAKNSSTALSSSIIPVQVSDHFPVSTSSTSRPKTWSFRLLHFRCPNQGLGPASGTTERKRTNSDNPCTRDFERVLCTDCWICAQRHTRTTNSEVARISWHRSMRSNPTCNQAQMTQRHFSRPSAPWWSTIPSEVSHQPIPCSRQHCTSQHCTSQTPRSHSAFGDR